MKILKNFFGSIRLTIFLMSMLFLLILFGTFAQVDLGIFEANEKYFTSWFIWFEGGSFRAPIFFGGYTIGLLLVFNLMMSHATKFKFKRSYLGIFLIHFGLIVLIIGSALTSWFGHEMQIAIKENELARYVEFPTTFELVIIDPSSLDSDIVYSTSLNNLKRSGSLTLSEFDIKLTAFYPNSYVNQRGILNHKFDQFGHDFKLIPLPKTYVMDEKNIPGIEIDIQSSSISPMRLMLWGGTAIYQELNHDNKMFLIALRPKREYLSFQVKLNDFSREIYDRTELAKSYVSKVDVLSDDGNFPFEISMNHPLRYRGYTFFQASFTEDEETSVFQVVKNPSWVTPYISSFLMVLGLFIQMIMSIGKTKNEKA